MKRWIHTKTIAMHEARKHFKVGKNIHLHVETVFNETTPEALKCLVKLFHNYLIRHLSNISLTPVITVSHINKTTKPLHVFNFQ